MEVDDHIRLLVAASAVIPVFNYDGWSYINLSEVLVYNGLVETYQMSEEDQKNQVLGQVRPFQNRHLLLLSSASLEAGFAKMNGPENVGFHEFTHLIDGADGDMDGVPKALMPPELIAPWIHLMYKEVERIKKGESDINPYGITSHAEFFAVAAEYFFKNPTSFEKKHEDLYNLLRKVFMKKS
jgi:Mlc titration factor MtfA (ptsG expression regulator)